MIYYLVDSGCYVVSETPVILNKWYIVFLVCFYYIMYIVNVQII